MEKCLTEGNGIDYTKRVTHPHLDNPMFLHTISAVSDSLLSLRGSTSANIQETKPHKYTLLHLEATVWK